MSGIYWLASYPRSGNTWLRLLLASCVAGGEPVDINRFKFGDMRARTRLLFDDYIGVPSALLTEVQSLRWRAAAVRQWAGDLDAPIHVKTHDAVTLYQDGTELIPAEVSLGAIYLVRDPRDVAISLARFLRVNLDRAIELMANPHSTADSSRAHQPLLLPDYWSSWSHNVESWTTGSTFPRSIVRYEDLRRDTFVEMVRILPALGYAVEEATVRRAIASVSLDRLKAQESAFGFAEAPSQARFFGEGGIGRWRTALTPEQAQRIERDHGATMTRLGYVV